MTTNQKSVAMRALEACEPENSAEWWSNTEDEILQAASEGQWFCKVKSIQGSRQYVSNILKMLGFSVSFYYNVDDIEYVEIHWGF